METRGQDVQGLSSERAGRRLALLQVIDSGIRENRSIVWMEESAVLYHGTKSRLRALLQSSCARFLNRPGGILLFGFTSLR